jgi:hypothetical protein
VQWQKNFKGLSDFLTYGKKLVNIMIDTFEWVLNRACIFFTGRCLQTKYRKIDEQLLVFLERVRTMDIEFKDQAITDLEKQEEMRKLYDDILMFAPTVIAYGDRHLKEQYTMVYNIANKFVAFLSTVCEKPASNRCEPVCYLVYGVTPGMRDGAGSGKSYFTQKLNRLIVQLYKRIPWEEVKLDKEVYNKAVEIDGVDAFWNAYMNQLICQHDDFGQKVDSVSQSCPDYMNLIREVNSVDFTLASAFLETKGKLHFTSKFVCATSNIWTFTPSSLVSSDAVNRRLHYKIAIFPKEDFLIYRGRKCTFNVKKMDDEPDNLPWVIRWKYGNEDFAPENCRDITLYELAEMLVQDRLKKEQLFTSVSDSKPAYVLPPPYKFPDKKGKEEVKPVGTEKRTKVRKNGKTEEQLLNEAVALVQKRAKDLGDKTVFLGLERLIKRFSLYEDPTVGAMLRAYRDKHGLVQPEGKSESEYEDCELVPCQITSSSHVEHLDSPSSELSDDDDVESVEAVEQKASIKPLSDKKKFAVRYFGKLAPEGLKRIMHQQFNLGDYTAIEYVHEISLIYETCKLTIREDWDDRDKLRFTYDSCRLASAIMSTIQVISPELSSMVKVWFLRDEWPYWFHCWLFQVIVMWNVIYTQPVNIRINDKPINVRNYYLENTTRTKYKNDIAANIEMYYHLRVYYGKYPETALGMAFSVVETVLKWAACFLIPMGAVIAVNKAVEYFKGDTVEGEMNPYDPGQVPRHGLAARRGARPVVRTEGGDTRLADTIKKTVSNMYTLGGTTKAGKDVVFNGVMALRGKMFMTVFHNFLDIFTMKEVFIAKKGRKVYRTDDYANIKYVIIQDPNNADNDAVIFNFVGRDHKDLVRHFIKEKDVEFIENVPGVFLRNLHPKVDEHETSMHHVYINKTSYTLNLKNGSPQHIPSGLTYNLKTAVGDCGSVLVADCVDMERKLMGIHNGSLNGTAYGTIITQERLEDALLHFESNCKRVLVVPNTRDVELEYEHMEGFTYVSEPDPIDGSVELGGMLDPEPKRGSVESSIRRSPINGVVEFDNKVYEACREPADLRPTKDYDPLSDGLKKVLNEPPAINMRRVKRAIEAIEARLLKNKKDFLPRKLTAWESYHGVEGRQYMAPMNRKSSVGYPTETKCPNHSNSKDYFLGKGEDRLLPVQFVESQDEWIRQIKEDNVARQTVFKASLKDECRPPEKVKKPRLFCAGDMEFTALCRRYTLPFSEHVMKNRIFNSIAVGINPHGEWGTLNAYLLQKGRCAFDGDIGKFDGSISHEVIMEICEMVIRIYKSFGMQMDEGDYNVIRYIFEQIAAAGVSFKGLLLLLNHSEPSGNPLTAIINSIICMVYILCVWQSVYAGTALEAPEKADEFIRYIVYGDDHAITISPDAWEFTQMRFKEEMAKMGIEYTDAQKSDKFVETKDLSECTFLKRQLGLHGKHGPLDIEIVRSICMYCKKGYKGLSTFAQSLETMFIELVPYGRTIFNAHMRSVHEACEKVGLDLPLHTYQFYVDRRNLNAIQVGFVSDD